MLASLLATLACKGATSSWVPNPDPPGDVRASSVHASEAGSVSRSPPAASSSPAATSAVAVAPSTPPLAPPSAAPSANAPLPHVRVENIGMHIGGGPNDALNKAPIADSVAPHLDEVRACWTRVDDASRGGDFGVDLLIQPEGGRAKVSHPRTSIRPDAFRDCVVAVFEQVDFKRPLKGLTMVSYSLRFTPIPGRDLP